MTVKVYHAKEPNFGMGRHPRFPSQYEYVAEVDIRTLTGTDALEEAYTQTNNIRWKWTTNAAVLWKARDELRSTSAGDVLEMDGVKYRVQMAGFKKISPAKPRKKCIKV